MMRRAALLALGALTLAAPARADEPFALKLAVGSPLTSPVYIQGTKPWIDKVTEAAAGTLRIDVYPGGALANPENIYDRLVNNVFELAYSIHGSIAGKFKKTSVAELPFLATESEHASAALWDLQEQGVIADEYAQVHPLALFIYPQVQLHFTRAVHGVEELKGLKIGVPNRIAGDVVDVLGATPLNFSPPDQYQALSRHMVAGVAMPWTGVTQFKIVEVTNYHLEIGLGSSTGFLMMNKPAYEKLPAKARDAVDRLSYHVQSQHYGAALDAINREQRARIAAQTGQTVTSPDAAEKALWAKQVQPVYDKWVERTPDGRKVIEAFRAALAKEMAK